MATQKFMALREPLSASTNVLSSAGLWWLARLLSDLIRVVTLHATVMASGSLTDLMGRTTVMSFEIIR